MARTLINPEMLAWAIEDTGATPQDVARATRRDLSTVTSWISGDSEPHRGDIEKFSKLLGRPFYFFLLPNPPRRQSLIAQYRQKPGAVDDARTQAEVLELKAAANVQRIASRLSGDAVIEFPTVTKDPELFAAGLRNWLQWDTKYQFAASSKIRAYRLLREAVESAGVIVLERKIGRDACRGFSLPHPKAPLLVINKDYDLASLRSYTLVHELSHLTRGEEYFCHGRDREVERWCDRVAAAFLMPADMVRHYVRSNLGTARVPDDDLNSVRLTSNRFQTSWEATARRLAELQLASRNLVDNVRGSEPPAKGFSPDGGTRTPQLRAYEYGTRFSRLLIGAAEERRIAELDARRSLRVDEQQYNELKSLLREGA